MVFKALRLNEITIWNRRYRKENQSLTPGAFQYTGGEEAREERKQQRKLRRKSLSALRAK